MHDRVALNPKPCQQKPLQPQFSASVGPQGSLGDSEDFFSSVSVISGLKSSQVWGF